MTIGFQLFMKAVLLDDIQNRARACLGPFFSIGGLYEQNIEDWKQRINIGK